MLNHLLLLDLSFNEIADLTDAGELPPNLAALDLRHNPCADGERWPQIEKEIRRHLAKRLNQLNGQYLNGVSERFERLGLMSEEQQVFF